MARKEQMQTRVDYWRDYRQTIKTSFTRSQKPEKKPKVVQKPVLVEEEIKPSVMRAEALLNEYEKKSGIEEESKREPNGLLFGLAIVVLLLIIAGVIFMIWRYQL